MERIVFHIDVNSAFLSWTAKQLLEKGYKKDIRNFISVVGIEEKRKCFVLAASTPAKKIGIRTPMNIKNAKQIYPGLIIAKPDYNYYKENSDQMMNFLKQKFKNFQQYSIDECFVEYTDMKNKFGDEVVIANKLKNYIEKNFGFTVNIGIGNNKFLAKMASDFEKPNKVHTLYKNEIKEKMRGLPIQDLFMCGEKSSKILKAMGINTIGELANTNKRKLIYKLGNHGKLLHDYANGKDDSKIQNKYEDRKSIGASSITRIDTIDKDLIFSFFEGFSQELSGSLDKLNLAGKSITIHIRYSDFSIKSHQRKLINFINLQSEIFYESKKLFEEIWNKKAINLVGISIGNLQNKKYKQQNLFVQ